MENDVVLKENTSSKRKEAGFTYQPSAKFYSSLSFSQEGSTDQTDSNIITLEFSYYPQDYESFHFEAEQRNDSTFNKEWQVWLAYSRDFDLPLFFIKVKGALKGNVFIDENNNGVLDKGEAPASNILFILGDSKAAVNKNGVFVFPSVDPGEYDLDIDISSLPVGLVARVPMPYEIKIKRGRTEHANIPLVKVCRVSGVVFGDTNKNGSMDEDEAGLPLIKLALESESFKPRDTFSAQDGKFSFATVPPGSYVLKLDKEWLPSRFIMTTPEEYELKLKPSQDALNIVFGAVEKKRPIIKTFTTKPLEPVKPAELPKPKNPIVEFFKRYILKK
ncbi:MAG: SdrD B-like domain-containing protein [Candidatus Omnitrophota bacterium]|nr:SdrD B-like domain-containing protein [Candidatus Omnitrophota bacterium]